MSTLPDLGDLIHIAGPDGSRATVARHGAHVVSWCTADATERLFLSSRAAAGPSTAIRGGIPICFPQFAGLGPLPKHGCARTSTWEHLGGGRFGLEVGADAWRGWPHDCTVTADVSVGPGTLTVALTVCNQGDEALDFTGALHTYLSCDDVTSVVVSGLEQRPIHGGGRVDGPIGFGDGRRDVDLSVLGARGAVRVDGLGGSSVLCAQTGFADVVVWNVGAELGASMSDLGSGEWRRYVCVEAAAVAQPVTVNPGQPWTGTQTLTVIEPAAAPRS